MFGDIFREARRAKRLSGVQLAKIVGCTQSAISQFEGGKRTALRRETIEKICAHLRIGMPEGLAADDHQRSVAAAADANSASRHGEPYCPNSGCPSNVPYVVDGAIAFAPRRQPDSSAAFCPWCGEVLMRECPECEAPATRTAFCPACGKKRVELAEDVADPVAWAARRRAEIAEIANSAGL